MKSNFNADRQFATVEARRNERSVFNNTRSCTTAFNEDLLIPFFVDADVLPGDTMSVSTSNFTRMITPQFPVYDHLKMDIFWFAIPFRLVYQNWEKLQGEQIDPGDSIDFMTPIIQAAPGGIPQEGLHDYMGLPTWVPNMTFSALPSRAYNLVWNEWFRSQDLQDSVIVDQDDGPDDINDYVLLKRNKAHDYFTSCAPNAQKGAATALPFIDSAPVVGTGEVPEFFTDVGLQGPYNIQAAGGSSQQITLDSTVIGPVDVMRFDASGETGLEADLTGVSAITINALRESIAVQEILERDARSGTRYPEILKSRWGVTSPDARLQRPEYLGGGSQPVNFSAVPNTSATATENQGDLAAFVTSTGQGAGFTKSFTEHTIVLGLCCITAPLTYQSGIHKQWSRRTRYDYYMPELAHLGEQAVLNQEIFAKGTAMPGSDEGVFGYQERWAEYRYGQSIITGKMRSVHPTSLDFKHLAQDFGAVPTLDSDFIENNAPVGRVVQVPSEPHFEMDMQTQVRHARVMPMRSTPGFGARL